MSRTPVCTYRIQLTEGFGFQQLAELMDYLSALGISHIYPSPYFQTMPGNPNPYAIVDAHAVNRELGGEEGHAVMVQALKRHALSQLLDIVPNHMATDPAGNRWWQDILRRGPDSPYAHYFDIDWEAPEARIHQRVLLPVLADQIGRIIDSGKLQIVRSDGTFSLSYGMTSFPVAPESLAPLLQEAAAAAQSEALALIADVLGASVPKHLHVLMEQLNQLTENEPDVADAIDQMVARHNVDPDRLDEFVQAQHYRLAWWRAGIHELNYRRFFNIDALVGLRVEDDDVFQDVHKRVLEWIEDGSVTALRVDHIDGLRDPEQYLRRLRQESPSAWIVVEKILAEPERLPESWPIAGTTGYDFLNRVAGLFVDPTGEQSLVTFYSEFTATDKDYSTWLRETKGLVLAEMFGGELNRLTHILYEICGRHRRYRDFTRHELHEALFNIINAFPVYRAYARPESGSVSDQDVTVTTQAIETAKRLQPNLDPRLFDFLRDILLLRIRGDLEDDLVLRFQQVTGPVMAKGLEDTAFYCYNRLISLNEVGGSPDHFGCSPDDFHKRCVEIQQQWPQTLLATATHDTKRGEDARLRIGMLSEIPDKWAEAVRNWSVINEQYRQDDLPERNAEYLFYQTLVGAWPLEVERAVAFMHKASREAKMHTSWIDPDPVYDQALRSFVEGSLSDEVFVNALTEFVQPLVQPARITSLAQTLLKLTAPGIPDIYQGCELWDHNLVDPDNRRPVDYALRRDLVAKTKKMPFQKSLRDFDSGMPKLMVIQRTLEYRKAHSDVFLSSY